MVVKPIMRKISLFCILFICLLLFPITYIFADSYGEQLQKKYAEYTKKSHPDDSYIILKDEKTVDLDKGGNYEIMELSMYKVLKEEGKFILGEKKLDFDEAFEKIKEIKAITISPVGDVKEASQIQEISPYSGFPIYSSHKLKVISLPGIVENSIIEIKTIITGKKVFNGEYWDDCYFQIDVPLLDSSYKITLPSNKKLYIRKMNLNISPVITKSRDGMFNTYYWHIQDVAKIELEEMAPSLFNTIPQIAVSTIDSWDRLGKLTWDLYKNKFELDESIKEQAKRLTKNKKSDIEKLEAILRYMQDNFRYVSLSFGVNAIEPHKAAETFANKYGDCKDQCAALTAMLKSVGIDSNFVLVNYIPNCPLFEDLPSPAYFKHVVLEINLKDGKTMLVDPLAKKYAPEDMHITLDATRLFIFDEDGIRFQESNAPDISNYTGKTEIKIVLKEDGSAVGEIKLSPSKKKEPNFRSMFKGISEKEKKEVCESFLSLTAPGGKSTSFTYADPENFRQQFYMLIKFDAPEFAPVTGEYIILDLSEFNNTALFSKPDRTQPIVSYLPKTEIYEYTYVLPKGYKVEYLPESFYYSSSLNTFSSSFRSKDNQIAVEHKLEFKVAELPASAYKENREIYNKISKEGKKRVILKKK